MHYIVSQEVNGGDQWYNDNTTLTGTSVATINSSIFWHTANAAWMAGASGARSFGPVSFTY